MLKISGMQKSLPRTLKLLTGKEKPRAPGHVASAGSRLSRTTFPSFRVETRSDTVSFVSLILRQRIAGQTVFMILQMDDYGMYVDISGRDFPGGISSGWRCTEILAGSSRRDRWPCSHTPVPCHFPIIITRFPPLRGIRGS